MKVNYATGELHPKAKLSSMDVYLIRQLADEGFSDIWIGDKFEITRQQVYRIKKRISWKHL